jgi:hypothetical protein
MSSPHPLRAALAMLLPSLCAACGTSAKGDLVTPGPTQPFLVTGTFAITLLP